MMASQPEPPEDLRWLLEPPAPGEVHVHVAVGEGAQLTPEVREAIEQLLTRLHEAESDVSGFCRLITCDALSKLGCLPRGGTCRICRLSG